MYHDIISIGSATKDVFLISRDFKLIKSKQFKTGIGECFSYGSKIELGDIAFDTGGGATNSAFTFANFGLKTSVVAKIGKDIYGAEHLHVLAEHQVNISNLVIDNTHKTAYSTILVVPEGDRTVLVYRGASANLLPAEIHWSNLKTKWFYISSLAGNLQLLDKIFAFAKKNKIKIAWNPGGEELRHGAEKLSHLIKQAYVFILNKEEAQNLTGKKDIKDLFTSINELSPGYNLITAASNGAYLSDGMLLYQANALPAKVINTTGAGDAFGSAFITGLILKNDWDFGLRLAILNSYGVVTNMGAKTGLLKKMPKISDLQKIKIKIYT